MKGGTELARAARAPGGYNLTMVASEAEVSHFGRLCWALIEHAERLYRQRCRT